MRILTLILGCAFLAICLIPTDISCESTAAPGGSTAAPGGSTAAPGGSTAAPGGATSAPGGAGATTVSNSGSETTTSAAEAQKEESPKAPARPKEKGSIDAKEKKPEQRCKQGQTIRKSGLS
ncbi:hypothetical protein AWZ03_010426 [Drosophila navojoa]|uniref:Uncharacterized protein n=1 Tax=Drosophila navojoa TaxID=7232 RepID=A0A484B5N8_DRONA|nr:hypothetical protein AWZ03_010426 [Drosophila navojoa]